MFSNLGGTRTRPRKVKVREAFKLLTDEEASKMINEEELKLRALSNAEQNTSSASSPSRMRRCARSTRRCSARKA
jgi:hypothetical protein